MRGENRSRIVLALVLLLVAAGTALSWSNSRDVARADAWVAHTHEVNAEIESLRGALVQVESAARGFALGGTEVFRAGLANAEALARSRLAAVRKLTADNPRQQDDAATLASLVDQKFAFNRSVVAAREKSGLQAAAALVAIGRGAELMERVQGILGRMQAEEDRLLSLRSAELERLHRWTLGVGVAVMAMLFIALIIFVAQVRLDLRARRTADDQVRSSEERLRLLLGAVHDYAILMLDADGRVQSWSEAAARMFGYSAEEITGRPFTTFYPPQLIVQGKPELELRGASQGRYQDEGPRLRKDGTQFWADVVVTAIRGEDGKLRGFAKVIRDVTERRLIDDALRETARKLEVSNRELQDFAMIASHDLQEPLRKIQMFGDKLRRRYGEQLGDEGKDWMTRMMNAAARGQSLIQGLLAFSRVTTKAQPPVPVDLTATAHDVVSDLEARIADVHGQVQVGALPVVEADPLQMRQLLQNLIGNALKFRKPEEPPVVRVEAQQQHGVIHLEVADNGIGFDQKYVDRIFKLFQRLHDRGAYEGSGMGLAICRKIVERHGGNITAQSEPGRGTKFIIDLPAQQAAVH